MLSLSDSIKIFKMRHIIRYGGGVMLWWDKSIYIPGIPTSSDNVRKVVRKYNGKR